jgi:hypothetical protein
MELTPPSLSREGDAHAIDRSLAWGNAIWACLHLDLAPDQWERIHARLEAVEYRPSLFKGKCR